MTKKLLSLALIAMMLVMFIPSVEWYAVYLIFNRYIAGSAGAAEIRKGTALAIS